MDRTDLSGTDGNFAHMEGAGILFPLLGVLFSVAWAIVLLIGTTLGLPKMTAYASEAAFVLFALLFALRRFRTAMPFLVVSGLIALTPLWH